MSIQEMVTDFEDNLRTEIMKLQRVTADKLGLDKRAGTYLYIDGEERAIYCPTHSLRSFDYYGGMEYVAEGEGRTTLAGFVRFDGYESERVAECFEFLNDVDSEDAE